MAGGTENQLREGSMSQEYFNFVIGALAFPYAYFAGGFST
jgi:hypothetical protein